MATMNTNCLGLGEEDTPQSWLLGEEEATVPLSMAAGGGRGFSLVAAAPTCSWSWCRRQYYRRRWWCRYHFMCTPTRFQHRHCEHPCNSIRFCGIIGTNILHHHHCHHCSHSRQYPKSVHIYSMAENSNPILPMAALNILLSHKTTTTTHEILTLAT